MLLLHSKIGTVVPGLSEVWDWWKLIGGWFGCTRVLIGPDRRSRSLNIDYSFQWSKKYPLFHCCLLFLGKYAKMWVSEFEAVGVAVDGGKHA